MKIKIETTTSAEGHVELTPASESAIDAALKAVNGKATTFTFCYPQDTLHLINRTKRHLLANNVLQSEFPGTRVTLRKAGPSANAYKNTAISTLVELTCTGSGWYLTDVKRATVYPRSAESYHVTVSDRTARSAVQRVLKAFGRTETPAEQPMQSIAA
jgi:hypothetical protein